MQNSRLANLKKLLADNSLDAALISSVPNIIYLTHFAHFNEFEREAFILVTAKKQYIFTDARYSHAVKTYCKEFTLKEIGTQAFSKLFKSIIREEKIKNLGIETNNLTVFEHKRIAIPNVSFKHFDLTQLRIKKDAEEIENIKRACEIGDQTFSYIRKKITEGMTEKQLAFEMEIFMRKKGCTPSFDTIVAFEENAAIPHHKSGERKLKSGDLILLDFGVKFDNYCSDMTRTIFFGQPSPEKIRVYNAVKDAQQQASNYIQESLSQTTASAAKADETARLHILGLGFQTIPHALGHGIGLQVHEAPTLSPRSNDNLENGMVFSIEPGIYLPDVFGVRIEDLFAIQDNTLVQITHSPKNTIII